MQQHIFLADRGENIAFVVGDPLGDTRREGRPEQVWTLVKHQLGKIGEAEHSADFNDLVFGHMQLTLDHLEQAGWSICRNGQANDFAATATFQGSFKFAHEVFCFILDFKITVAQHPKTAGAFEAKTGEKAGQMLQQQLFQWQEAELPFRRGQRDKPCDLGGNGQERLQLALISRAFKLERQSIARVWNKRKGMCRVNGQGREHGEDLL